MQLRKPANGEIEAIFFSPYLTAADMVYSGGSFSARNAVNALPADKQPSACIGCGHCQALCPQQIHIPDIMRDLARRISE